ncbi:class I SAM-dependent methyltransferase [Flindersiella endophytica]
MNARPGLADIFNATREEFVALSAALWDPLARELVADAAPAVGERVLDACCGAGSSALPSADAVGPDGHVDGVDLATALLGEGERLAAERGLRQLRFTEADVTAWDGGGKPYDLVQCAYGIFFFPDIPAGTSALVRLLRPGGRLAVLVWERDAIDRVTTLLYQAVRPERPELGNPWQYDAEPYNTPERMESWLAGLGLERVHTRRVGHLVPLDDRLAWTLVLGGGMRGMLLGLAPDQVERIRDRFLRSLADNDIRTLDATSVIGVGHRPAG